MLTALAALSFIGGLFISQPLIFVSIPVTLLLGFILLRSADPRVDVEVTRTTERVRIRERETTRVRLRARNSGPRAIPMLLIRDRVQPGLRGPNTRSGFSLALRAGETRDLYYEVLANEFGVHTLGPITLAAQDSTGLLESRAELGSYSEIAVFPESAEKLTHFSIRPRRTKSWPGEIVARRTGSGMDYYNIRRFTPGDSVKRINWRASARHAQGGDEFLVNEYMAEVGAEVLIVVDAGRTEGRGRDTAVTQSAKAALSIAERLLHDRNRVGLLTTGANPSRIPAAYGKRHFDRIALSLLQLQPAETDVGWWVERSLHLYFPNVSQIVFVSALTNAGSLATAAEVIRHGARDVIIVSPNILGLTSPRPRDLRSRERGIARKLAEMERTIDLNGLRAANALVIDWTTSASLEEVIEVHRRALARHAALSARHG
jgi:uncharacterized protein (DUF58 family)